MGNCMEREVQSNEGERKQEVEEQEEKMDDTGKEGGGGSGTRIKIVLTKEELEYLMFHLKHGGGGRRLEDLLAEIERERRKEKAAVAGWRPSLESIMESPEVQEIER
ncbi:hypothetical protein NMG60_11030552 [Bertholletia excelsa]